MRQEKRPGAFATRPPRSLHVGESSKSWGAGDRIDSWGSCSKRNRETRCRVRTENQGARLPPFLDATSRCMQLKPWRVSLRAMETRPLGMSDEARVELLKNAERQHAEQPPHVQARAHVDALRPALETRRGRGGSGSRETVSEINASTRSLSEPHGQQRPPSMPHAGSTAAHTSGRSRGADSSCG